MTDFLPEDYEAPQNKSSYMKLQEGENRLRILSRPIVGWIDWENKKPIRFPFTEKPEKSVDPKKPVKHFWALIVWNYQEQAINILEITQVTIQQGITLLTKDPEWGAPYNYDIKITKTGEGMETEYSVSPSPHKPVTSDIMEAFHAKPCNLDKLFDGKDPFDTIQGTELMATDLPL